MSFTYNANRLDAIATSSKQETDATSDENQISREMNNSIAMLNYLTVVNQEINDSSNSRLFLEEVYSSLINNTSPNAVDDRTQVQLGDMLDTIDQYRMIDVKRDRLLYIYEQNKAQALRDAVPNPLGLLSSVRSFSLPQLLFSVTYMAIDAKASYDTSMAHAEMEYLQDGWELDDAAMKALSVSRENLFDYMIDMVQDKKIPDDYALTEDAVKRFVKCKNNTNVSRRIQFLESNKSTYERFGDYWLVLADSYHANGDYGKCLEAVKEYEDIQAKIFRKDHELANTMPLAIVAAEESITRLDNFSIEDFTAQIKDAVIQNTKSAVINAPEYYEIPVVQIERKITEIKEDILSRLREKFNADYGVYLKDISIAALDINKESEGYKELIAVTKDLTAETRKAKNKISIKDMVANQKLGVFGKAANMFVDVKENAYARRKQTQHKYSKEVEQELAGRVGAAGAKIISALNKKNTTESVQRSSNDGTTPPPVPVISYYIVLFGQPAGPYDMDTLQKMVNEGGLNKNSLVWTEGMVNWVEAGEVDDLAGIFTKSDFTQNISPIPPIPGN